jgi:hypothetical protein
MGYNTRTHHSNMDVHDCVQPGDLMQGAAIMATFVYHTAMREQNDAAHPDAEAAAQGKAATE